jgi:hypothetical protein
MRRVVVAGARCAVAVERRAVAEARRAVAEARCVAVEALTSEHFAPVSVAALTAVGSNAAQRACPMYSHGYYQSSPRYSGDLTKYCAERHYVCPPGDSLEYYVESCSSARYWHWRRGKRLVESRCSGDRFGLHWGGHCSNSRNCRCVHSYSRQRQCWRARRRDREKQRVLA